MVISPDRGAGLRGSRGARNPGGTARKPSGRSDPSLRMPMRSRTSSGLPMRPKLLEGLTWTGCRGRRWAVLSRSRALRAPTPCSPAWQVCAPMGRISKRRKGVLVKLCKRSRISGPICRQSRIDRHERRRPPGLPEIRGGGTGARCLNGKPVMAAADAASAFSSSV